jgi:hypothetical protein
MTPRDNGNAGFSTAEFSKESTAKHLSFRNSKNHNFDIPVKQYHEAVPFPSNILMPRVNTFAKKSMSTQEYIPIGTSTDLSRAIKNISRDNLNSPSGQQSHMRSSVNADYNPISSFGNQSSTFTMQPVVISKDKNKHRFYKSK